MKNLAASVHARLAQRRAKTGEDFNVLLVRFTLERLLYRLSRSRHREQFVLKGAMLFALWEPTLHRVTRDLDLLGFGNPTQERLADIFRELCRQRLKPTELNLIRAVSCAEDIRAQDEYAGIRVKLRGQHRQGHHAVASGRWFRRCALVSRRKKSLFPSCSAWRRPSCGRIRRETVIAEKLEAIVKLGMLNTRFKDYFDLHYLAQKFPFEGALLSNAIAGTFERRGTPFPDGLPVGLTPTFGTDTAKIRGWAGVLAKDRDKDRSTDTRSRHSIAGRIS